MHTATEIAEHRRAGHLIGAARRSWDQKQMRALLSDDTALTTLEGLAGFVIANTQPTGVSRRRWAAWCAYVALTGRRPPAWLLAKGTRAR